ncbi:hypothetical protein ACFLQZ_01135 [Acidobacteriota bacterium]
MGTKGVDGADVSYPGAYGGEVGRMGRNADFRVGKNTPCELARYRPLEKTKHDF